MKSRRVASEEPTMTLSIDGWRRGAVQALC